MKKMKKNILKRTMALALAGVCAFAGTDGALNNNVLIAEAAVTNPPAPKNVEIHEGPGLITWNTDTSKYSYIQLQFVIGDNYNGNFSNCVTYSTPWIGAGNTRYSYRRYCTDHVEIGGRDIKAVRIRSRKCVNGRWYTSKWNQSATWIWVDYNTDGYTGRVVHNVPATFPASFYNYRIVAAY